MKSVFLICFACGSILGTLAARAAEYDVQLQQSVIRCEQIDADDYQTGLWFNPDGYRSYYIRSNCYQQAAERLRTPQLCAQVNRRLALFSSSWGVSESNCRAQVAKKLEKDRTELMTLRQQYLEDPVRLVALRMEPNGNGRDYDFIPLFEGNFAHRYRLTLSLIDDLGSRHLIHENSYHISGPDSRLSLYVRRTDIQAAYPPLEPDRNYRLQAQLELSVGTNMTDGMISDDVLEGVFPAAERTQSLVTNVSFRAAQGDTQ